MYQRSETADFDQWRHTVSQSFVPLEAERVSPGAFTGSIDVQDCGAVVMTCVQARSHAVVRTEALADSAAEKFFKVSLQLEGHGLLVQDGREVVLEPGTLSIYDTSRPYTLSFDEQFSSCVLMFPHEQISLDPRLVGQLTATRLGAEHQLADVVGRLIARTEQVLPELSDGVGRRLAGNVVDLLTTVMADELAGREGQELTEQQRLRATITAYIEARLADPQLTPASIAAAHFMSVRSLHGVFEGSGETVSGLIRQRRVEGSRRDLADPLQLEVPVALIGARWGLADPAHFSRLFRAVVGSSPAQYRQQVHAA